MSQVSDSACVSDGMLIKLARSILCHPEIQTYHSSKCQTILQDPGAFDQVSCVWVVHRTVDFFRSLLKSREDLLQLRIYNRIVTCGSVLAEVGEKKRVFADALYRLQTIS